MTRIYHVSGIDSGEPGEFVNAVLVTRRVEQNGRVLRPELDPRVPDWPARFGRDDTAPNGGCSAALGLYFAVGNKQNLCAVNAK